MDLPGYELSRRAGVLGTPERPLSDLGLRSYVTFWISVLIRFFRQVLVLIYCYPLQRLGRRVLTVGVSEVARISGMGMEAMIDGIDSTRRKKRTKGVDGEMELVAQTPSGPIHSIEGVTLSRLFLALGF